MFVGRLYLCCPLSLPLLSLLTLYSFPLFLLSLVFYLPFFLLHPSQLNLPCSPSSSLPLPCFVLRPTSLSLPPSLLGFPSPPFPYLLFSFLPHDPLVLLLQLPFHPPWSSLVPPALCLVSQPTSSSLPTHPPSRLDACCCQGEGRRHTRTQMLCRWPA